MTVPLIVVSHTYTLVGCMFVRTSSTGTHSFFLHFQQFFAHIFIMQMIIISAQVNNLNFRTYHCGVIFHPQFFELAYLPWYSRKQTTAQHAVLWSTWSMLLFLCLGCFQHKLMAIWQWVRSKVLKGQPKSLSCHIYHTLGLRYTFCSSLHMYRLTSSCLLSSIEFIIY